jgi:transcriptional regulator with XRE-family HTH domain
MNTWTTPPSKQNVDIEVLEESALAMAQSTIQGAINAAGISKADLARKIGCNRSFVSRMLAGSHNLTVKTMARTLAACGFEVRFERVRIEWNWADMPMPITVPVEEVQPVQPGCTSFGFRFLPEFS